MEVKYNYLNPFADRRLLYRTILRYKKVVFVVCIRLILRNTEPYHLFTQHILNERDKVRVEIQYASLKSGRKDS